MTSMLVRHSYRAFFIMINITPNNDLKPHTEDTTCACNPKILIENGEMIVVHNSYDGRELNDPIKENTRSLKELYDSGKISKDDIIEQLKVAEEEEEFEVAISIRDVLNAL